MKKILCFVLTVLLMEGTVAFSVDPPVDVAGTAYEEAYVVLSGLGVVQGYEDGSFHPENNITRAELTKIVYYIMGTDLATDKGAYAAYEKFIDVLPEHWANTYINTLADWNIIDGHGNGTFMPEDYVTYNQAVKIIVSVLGYTVAANEKGGYPSGYTAVAAELGLIKGMSMMGGDYIKRGDLITILYRALETDMLSNVSTSNVGAWRVQRGKTLLNNLEELKNIKIIKGQVMATPLTSIVGGEPLREDEISIDGLICKLGENANYSGLLGRYVIALTEYNKSMDTYIISSFYLPSNKNKTLAINGRDVISFENYGYKYSDGDGKEKRLEVSKNISVVYNGAGLSAISPGDFEIVNGSLTFLDSKGTGEYDVLFIDSYRSYVVSSVNPEGNIITFMGNRFESLSSLNIKSENGYKYFISDQRDNAERINPFDAATLAVPWNDDMKLSSGDVLSVFESMDGKTVLMVISNRIANGMFEEIDYTSGKVILSEKEMELAKYDVSNWIIDSDDLKLNVAASLYMDAFGYIVAINNVNTPSGDKDDETVARTDIACVINKQTSKGVSGTLEMQLLKGNILRKREELKRIEDEEDEKAKEEGKDTRVWTVYEQSVTAIKCANKVIYNGERVNSADLMKRLPQNAVIYYRLNGDGLISSIETLEAGQTIYRRFAQKNFIFGNGSLTGAFRADENTVFFVIPKGAQNPSDYEVIYYMPDNSSHTATPYGLRVDFNSNSEIATAAVIDSSALAHETGLILTSTKVTVVQKFSHVLSEDGIPVKKLYGYTEGELREYLYREDFNNSNFGNELRVGDVVKLSIDVDGNVDNYMLLGRLSENTPLYRAGIRGTDERALVKAYNKRTGVLQPLTLSMVDKLEVSFTGDYLDISSYDINDGNRNQMYVFDRRTNAVSVATVDNIATYLTSGEDGVSTLFLYISLNDLKALVIVK